MVAPAIEQRNSADVPVAPAANPAPPIPADGSVPPVSADPVVPVAPSPAPPAVNFPAPPGGNGGDPPAGAAPSNDEDLQPASRTTLLIGWGIVGTPGIVAIVCALGIFFAGRHRHDHLWWCHSVGRWQALTFGFACACFGLLVLQLLGQDKGYGVFRPIIGKDKRYSTSLAQIGLWTVAVVTAVAILLGWAMFEGQVFDTLTPDDRWNQYLLLLGGPLAAAVVAKGVVTYKLASGTLQKSEPTTTAGSQVFKADKGSADLVDAQYLLFNVIAPAYFVIQFAKTATLPEIPSTLLALTGATAATYVANKATQKNAPRITSISTLTAEVGGQIVVYGENFDPGDKCDDARRVTLQLGSYTEHLRVRLHRHAGPVHCPRRRHCRCAAADNHLDGRSADRTVRHLYPRQGCDRHRDDAPTWAAAGIDRDPARREPRCDRRAGDCQNRDDERSRSAQPCRHRAGIRRPRPATRPGGRHSRADDLDARTRPAHTDRSR